MRDLKQFKLYNPLLFSQKAFGVKKIGNSFSVERIGDPRNDEPLKHNFFASSSTKIDIKLHKKNKSTVLGITENEQNGESIIKRFDLKSQLKKVGVVGSRLLDYDRDKSNSSKRASTNPRRAKYKSKDTRSSQESLRKSANLLYSSQSKIRTITEST